MSVDREVAAAFDRLPKDTRACLLKVRDLVFRVAAASTSIGALTETLRWGQPSYLTDTTKAGTTLRLWRRSATSEDAAVFVPCQSSVIDTCRLRYPDLSFDGDRAIALPLDRPVSDDALAGCINLALTYHLWKGQPGG